MERVVLEGLFLFQPAEHRFDAGDAALDAGLLEAFDLEQVGDEAADQVLVAFGERGLAGESGESVQVYGVGAEGVRGEVAAMAAVGEELLDSAGKLHWFYGSRLRKNGDFLTNRMGFGDGCDSAADCTPLSHGVRWWAGVEMVV